MHEAAEPGLFSESPVADALSRIRNSALLISSLFFVCILFASGCAVQRAPGGGPEDKTSPVMQAVNVSAGSVNVDRRQVFEFSFSEALDEVSVKRGVRVFPLNSGDYSVKYSRRTITVSPVQGWRDNQAYMILIDNAVTDLRRNPLDGSISYSFSTGPTLPQGRVSGQVYGLGSKEAGTLLIGPQIPVDSLFSNYSYVLQTDGEGRFSMSYLPEIPVRIIGFVDLDKSRSYDPHRDHLILPDPLDIRIESDTAAAALDMQVLRGNFLTPLLLSAKSTEPGLIELKFSKALHPSSEKETVLVNGLPAKSTAVENEFLYLYHELPCPDSLSIDIPSLSDTLGLMSADSTLRIRTPEYRDTLYSTVWKDGLLSIHPAPPLDSLPVLYHGERDSLLLTLNALRPGLFAVKLPPPYRGQLKAVLPPPPCVPDFPDSTEISVNIRATEAAGTGSLIVRLSDSDSSRCLLISSRNYRRILHSDNPGLFRSDSIPEGKHSLFHFLDRNGNGHPDPGTLVPSYQAPEIIRPLLENFEIRANWETELDLRIEKN